MVRCLVLVLWIAQVPMAALGDPGAMSAAGRLEHDDHDGTCSASLIAPDLVATAAHCAGSPTGLRFRPGGKVSLPTYAVKSVLRHPLYDPQNDPDLWKFRFDMAVLRLETPVPPSEAIPFALGSDAELGESLFLVSWTVTSRPVQRKCPVIEGYRGLVTLGCAVAGGESGAPVVRDTSSGPELVAIISSRTRQRFQPVAQASNVRLRLPPLIRQIE